MRRVSVLLFSLSLAALGLAGCVVANLDKYYTPETTEHFPRTENVALVDGGQDAEAVYQRMYASRGYLRIGRISFVGPWQDDSVFMNYARNVGADVVIVSRRYVDSRVVEADRGKGAGTDTSSVTTPYGDNPPKFDRAYAPEPHENVGRDSYVVRDYRHLAIFLRRIAG